MKVHLQANTSSVVSYCGQRYNPNLTTDPAKVTCKICLKIWKGGQ